MPLDKRQTPINVRLPEYGVYVLESHHAPSFRMGVERHPFLELFFVLHGRGRFEIDGIAHTCLTNDLVAIPPGCDHSIHDAPADPLALYAVCVSPELPALENDLLQSFPTGTLRVGNALASQARSIFRQLIFEQTHQRPFRPTVIVGLTLELIATLARWVVLDQSLPTRRGESRPGSAVRRAEVERYVAELGHRFFERATLDGAAAELGMSRRRFTTLFAETTGQTWADYVAALRIQYARKLLRETSRSVAAIAFECGYEELSSFYRAFRRQTGDSPGHWRIHQGSTELPDLQIDIARPAKTRP